MLLGKFMNELFYVYEVLDSQKCLVLRNNEGVYNWRTP